MLSESAFMHPKLVASIVCRWLRLVVAVVAACRFLLAAVVAVVVAACRRPLVDDATSVAVVAER